LYTGQFFLWERFCISRRITTLRQTGAGAKSSGSTLNRLAVVGNPGSDHQLKATIQAEIEKIAQLFDTLFDLTGPILEQSLHRERLLELLSTHEMFHFAGHFREHTDGRSGWELAKGDLFGPRDIASLVQAPKCIFSNTCGHPMAVAQNGFIRAFLDAGTQAYVTTIGPIPSHQATCFSRTFYHSLGGGETVDTAVHTARRALIDEFGWEDLSWSFYVLYGDATWSLKLNEQHKFPGYKLLLGLLLTVLILAGIYAVYQRFKPISFHLESQPHRVWVQLEEFVRLQTPVNLSLHRGQEISLYTIGYDTLHGRVQPGNHFPVIQPLDPVQALVTDSLVFVWQQDEEVRAHLIPDELFHLEFQQLGGRSAELFIQGWPQGFSGDSVTLAVDGTSRRFIVRNHSGVFDAVITVSSDTTIVFEEDKQHWYKDRFQ